jgi:TatD DNase family protein
MVDAHCHLNFKAFEKDLDEVIKRATSAGIDKIINVGASLETSKTATELTQKYQNLYATVGIHPHHADKLEENWEESLEALATKPKVLAIGETGLDYFPYESNGVTEKALQKKLFETQINIAKKLNLPLMIHNRQAGDDILDILLHYKSSLLNPPGLFHCFSGNIEFLKKVLDLGFYVGFDGNITYKGIAKGEDTPLSKLVEYTPLDRIISETDSPYLPPIPYRGSRNEPSYVIIVAEFIAKIKKIEVQAVIAKTIQNACNVFNF